MAMLANPYLIFAIASAIVAGTIGYGEIRYKHGANAEIVKAQSGIETLQSIIKATNDKQIQLSNSQRESYRDALTIRNADYDNLANTLSIKEAKLYEAINTTVDTCVNISIPIEFK